MRTGRLLLLVLATFVFLFSRSVAHAQTPSALVLEKRGVSVPDFQPYTEIPTGMTISLSPKASLVFQHYHTCRTVTVTGGKVTFKAETYTISGGTKEREIKTPCPRTVRLKAGGESGGILMRGVSRPTFSARPGFVVIGRRARDFSLVRISRGGTVLLEVPLDDRRFDWPANAAPLAAGNGYKMFLIPKMAGKRAVTTKFRVMGTGEAKGLLLIRVD